MAEITGFESLTAFIRTRTNLPCIVFLLILTQPVIAGVYFGSTDPARSTFIISHPPGFDGSGGFLEVKICLDPASDKLLEPLERALGIWNGLVAMQGNCNGCIVAEEEEPTTGLFDPMSTLLHELGHCAMGLDHTNWLFVDPDNPVDTLPTSHTNSFDATVLFPGDDGIPGTFDDFPFPLPGSRIVHWFRKDDNNPVVVDGLTIDEDTFTRSLSALPSGHTWPANANRFASATLGAQNTHAVMYSLGTREQSYLGLTADEVNTVKMGMTGLDRKAGTGDDYTISLNLASGCSSPNDINVRFGSPLTDPGVIADGTLGVCIARLVAIPVEGEQLQHYALTNSPFNFPMEIILNRDQPWDFSIIFFMDDFESGTFSDWTTIVP